MNRCRVGRGVLATLIVTAFIASCGGSDGGGDGGAAAESSASEVAGATPTDASAATESSDDDSSDTASGDASPSGATAGCEAIFPMAEIEAFLAEPVALSEDTNDSLGQLVCTWESIEDPGDAEDLAYKLLVLQLYSGDPIDGASFFDPSVYESVTTIDGIGDLAFSADVMGTTYNFVDGQVGGSLTYSEVDMGDADAPKLHTPDEVEQLFRTFHDRVT